jgi:hypothetical protein
MDRKFEMQMQMSQRSTLQSFKTSNSYLGYMSGILKKNLIRYHRSCMLFYKIA